MMRIIHRWKILTLAVFAALFLLMAGCSDDSANDHDNADVDSNIGNDDGNNNNNNNAAGDAGDAGNAGKCDPNEDPSSKPDGWCLESSCECEEHDGEWMWMCWAMVCPMDVYDEETLEPEPECNDGDTQTLDCNSCFCNEEGTWNCTEEDCGGHTEPCEGLTCGDACTICEDPDCVESDRNKFCNADGQCDYTDTSPECSESCREGDTKQVDCNSCICDGDGNWGCSEMDCSVLDPCDGLTCGDACSTCDPETDGVCPTVMEFCDEDGICSSDTPACI